MSGHRKAALALHALDAEDQAAVLAELPDADRRIVRAYLAELAELGFDPDAIDDVLGARPAPAGRDLVGAADAADILRVVGAEPVGFLGALLSAGPWSWEAELLAALPGHVRVRLQAQRAREHGPAPARAAFVVGAVAEALAAHGGGLRKQTGRDSGRRKWFAPWIR